MTSFPWLEILVAAILIAFFGALIGNYIYKKKHHLPTGECSCCKSSKLIKEYRKAYPKKEK